MHPCRRRYLGCKQNPGHPVNDLFDLGTVHSLIKRIFNLPP